jgi:hypothetical protein
MILIEARVNVAEAKKQIAGICNSYEEKWSSEDRAELLCGVEDLTLYVIIAGLLNAVFIQFFLEKANGENMFTDITYLVEKVERYTAENKEKVKSLLRLLGERLDAVFAAATPYPYQIFTLDFTNTLFYKLLKSPCVINMLLIRDKPSLLAHLIAKLVRIHTQKTDATTTEIFHEIEIAALPQLAQCLQGQGCVLETTRTLLHHLQQICPVDIDNDVAVFRKPMPSSQER